MPICFDLTNKVSGLVETCQEIDEKLATAFNAPVHEEKWYMDWYNKFGIMLAAGDSWETIRECWEDEEEIVAVTHWIEGRYTVHSWRE